MRRHHDPDVDVWDPLPLSIVAGLLARTSAWLSGGVAIDHWLGEVTRPHGDIDVSVVAAARAAFLTSLPTTLRPFAAQDGWLTPFDELDDRDGALARIDNVWCRDERSGRWALQVNAERGDHASWTYRRDDRVTLPWERAVLVVDGVRTIAPEVQLLWKSPTPVTADLADRRHVLPRLDAPARAWLERGIATAHPESPWAGQEDGVPRAR